MLLKKIKTNFFVIVDIATPIRMNDSYLDDVGSIRKCVIEDSRYWKERTQYKRINYSTSPLSNCKSISLQEVKELIGEVDVEKKAELYVWGGVYLSEQEKQQTEIAYMTGYNQALEDNKEKKYTEEDMRKAFDAARRCITMPIGGAKHQYYDEYSVADFDEYKREILPAHTSTEWEVEIVDGKLKLK